MPCAVTGCLKRPASPTRAQPGAGRLPLEARSIVSGTTTTAETWRAWSSSRGLSTAGNRRSVARYVCWRCAAEPRVISGGPATESRCTPSSHGADISPSAVDVDLAPVRVREAPPSRRRASPSRPGAAGLRRVPAGGRPWRSRPSAPMTHGARIRSPVVEDHAAHRVILRARADEVRDPGPKPQLGACGAAVSHSAASSATRRMDTVRS